MDLLGSAPRSSNCSRKRLRINPAVQIYGTFVPAYLTFDIQQITNERVLLMFPLISDPNLEEVWLGLDPIYYTHPKRSDCAIWAMLVS